MVDIIDPTELGFEVFGYSGDEALVLCPYHDDHSPSARFNVKTGLFHCFVCGTGKRAKDIAREFGGHVSEITSAARRKVDYIEPDVDWRTRFLSCPLALDNDYLASRFVGNDVIKKLSIRECEDGIIFPLFSDKEGTVCGVQVRQYKKEPKYVFYGEKPGVYPLTLMPPHNKAYLVEGIFSVIRGRQAGFAAFATMGAASLKPALRYFYDRTKVFGMFDPDAAGYIASAKLASIGIACLQDDFSPDDMSVPDWMNVVGDPRYFTMDTFYFINKAIAAGQKPKTVMNQILKFEKENS
jgi:DNA primase